MAEQVQEAQQKLNDFPFQKPSKGRIVIVFNSVNGKMRERAAIICHVHEDGKTINVKAFNEDGSDQAVKDIRHMSEAGTNYVGWDYPARV